MAQSTPTHASGFHLVTVAMTGHAEDKGSTTVAHSSLNRVVLMQYTRAEAGTWVCIGMINGLLACCSGSRVLPFRRILGVILGGRTYHERYTKHNQHMTICNNMMHDMTWQNESVLA